MEELLKNKRNNLKPTTTVVHKIPIVPCGNENNITGVISPEEITEYFDSQEELQQKAKELANHIRTSSHFVVYTGAGISTAAKIPDYRGPNGVWTLRAQGKSVEMKINLKQAIPTYSHMALVTLYRAGLLKYIVSTNVDGLHRRSGLPDDCVADLHGNIYREYCPLCNTEYLRSFEVKSNFVKRNTGRLCEKRNENGDLCCLGKLRDSIINFGENLPKNLLENSIEQSKKADLTLVIGSSMRVSPACNLPSYSYQRGGKFCLLNLQKTPFDNQVEKSNGIRIFSKCDEFMKMVMDDLEIEVDEWQLEDDILRKEMEGIVVDPDFGETMNKYNVYSMSDDGPPPTAVLDQIRNGFNFNRHVVVQEKSISISLGCVIDLELS